MTGPINVRDRRRLPFVMVTKAAIEAIRGGLGGRKGQTALAVYVALVECANDARSESFSVKRVELAERGMVEMRTLERYLIDLRQLDLVQIESGKAEAQPNVYTLIDPPRRYGSGRRT